MLAKNAPFASCTGAQLSGRLAGWLLYCALLTYCPQDLPNYIWAGYTATMPMGGTERLNSNIFTVKKGCETHQDHLNAHGTRWIVVSKIHEYLLYCVPVQYARLE